MNSCQKFSELFSEYLEKALVEEDRRDLEKHLQSCPPCQQAVDRLIKLRRNLKSLGAIAVSPTFETVLRTRMSLERHRLRPWFLTLPLWRGRTMALAAASLLLVVVAAFSYLRYSSSSASVLPQTVSVSKTSPVPTTPSTVTPSLQRYVYELDRYTIPESPGAPLRISSLGLARYQASEADSTAIEPAAASSDVGPVLISF